MLPREVRFSSSEDVLIQQLDSWRLASSVGEFSCENSCSPLIQPLIDPNELASEYTDQKRIDRRGRRSRSNQSWVFTLGYGERLITPLGKRIKCLMPGCSRVYTTSNSSTSNLKKHLYSMHGITEDSGDRFSLLEPLEENERLRDYYMAIEDFIVKSGSSHKLVADAGLFRLLKKAHVLKVTDLDVSPEIIQKSVEQSILEYKPLLRQLLSLNECISITLDRRTCNFGKIFYGVTAHFIDEGWKKRETLLALISSTDDYGDRMRHVVTDLGITDKVFTVTADHRNGLSDLTHAIEAACPNFKIKNYVPCLGQILSEVISGTLEPCLEFNDVIIKIKAGVSFIKQLSPSANPLKVSLESNQDDLLWDTCYTMVSNVLDSTEKYNNDCLRFGFPHLTLSVEDCMFLVELKGLFEIFHDFATRLLTCRYPTLSQAGSLYGNVLNSLSSTMNSTLASIRDSSNALYLTMNLHYSWDQTSVVHHVATAMDPRAKFTYWKKSFKNHELLIQLVTNIWNQHFRIPSPTDELQAYIEEALLIDDGTDCVMNYWRHSSRIFPSLARMARIFLAIPATSSPSKVLFQGRDIPTVPAHHRSSQALENFLLLESWKPHFASN